MDKTGKLQRYSRKDYAELVEFPVEIVGRDGVVRRYSFEDSVRLYQRRITFAPLRYRDVELVQAEVGHCRSRIEQLRRSFFHRFGWGTPEGQPAPAEVFGELAGELAAFLCRVLRVGGRPDIRFEPVEPQANDHGASTWYVVPEEAEQGMLLYVYRFDDESSEEAREGFFGLLKELERAGRLDGDQERLLAFHHTVDCGFVLTGRAGEIEALPGWSAEDDETGELEPTSWDVALDTIRRGDFEEALAQCRQLTVDQPLARDAYVAGSMLAIHLGRHDLGEDLALVGSGYFPDDPVLHLHAGLACVGLERLDDAVPPLRRAVALDPGLVAARFVLVLLLLDAGRVREALRLLQERDPGRADDRRADAALERIGQWARWRRAMSVIGAGCTVLGIVAIVSGAWLGLVPAVLGLTMGWTASLAFRRTLHGLAQRHRFDDVSTGLRRIHRRPDTQEPLVC